MDAPSSVRIFLRRRVGLFCFTATLTSQSRGDQRNFSFACRFLRSSVDIPVEQEIAVREGGDGKNQQHFGEPEIALRRNIRRPRAPHFVGKSELGCGAIEEPPRPPRRGYPWLAAFNRTRDLSRDEDLCSGPREVSERPSLYVGVILAHSTGHRRVGIVTERSDG